MILWHVLILDVVLIAAGAWIATHYERFYQYWCQMYEPFTRWISRFATAHGHIYWYATAIIFLATFTGILTLRWEWRILDAAYWGFQCWFIFHIKDYVIEHSGDNPPIGFRIFKSCKEGKWNH